jgi:hypothetical protein
MDDDYYRKGNYAEEGYRSYMPAIVLRNDVADVILDMILDRHTGEVPLYITDDLEDEIAIEIWQKASRSLLEEVPRDVHKKVFSTVEEKMKNFHIASPSFKERARFPAGGTLKEQSAKTAALHMMAEALWGGKLSNDLIAMLPGELQVAVWKQVYRIIARMYGYYKKNEKYL